MSAYIDLCDDSDVDNSNILPHKRGLNVQPSNHEIVDLCNDEDEDKQPPVKIHAVEEPATITEHVADDTTLAPILEDSDSSDDELPFDEEVDPETRALLETFRRDERALKKRRRSEEQASLILLQEEQRCRQSELENKLYKCGICLSDDIVLSDMITLSCEPIPHRFCKGCFSGYCESKIMEAAISSRELVCPAEKCTAPVTIFELQSNVSAELFSKYERFSIQAYAAQDNDCRTCPKCNEWIVEIPQEDDDEGVWKSVHCELCKHKFCGRCGEKPHKGMKDQNLSCADYANWVISNAKADEDFEAFLATNAKNLSQCPKCNVLAELTQGCCKFTYCRCGEKWCFLCGVGLEEKNHYSHFQGKGCTGPYGNKCCGSEDVQITREKKQGPRAAVAGVGAGAGAGVGAGAVGKVAKQRAPKKRASPKAAQKLVMGKL